MSENDIVKPSERRLRSPHDVFGRKFLQIPVIASDLLEYYADATIADTVDVSELQPAPTHGISKALKEVILDVAYLARLRDTEARSNVLFVLEHKSRPSPMVALQVGTQAFVTLYSAWSNASYSESKTFELPIPILIVLYHGSEDWEEKEIWFQDLFKDIPPALRDLVPRFKVLVINLRRFQYGQLPGRPLTRAFVESLMRATDGTFAMELDSVFRHIYDAGLDPTQTWDCVQTVTGYCDQSVGLSRERLEQVILKIFPKEGTKMLETIPAGMFRDGFVHGRDEGIAIGVDKGITIGMDKGKAERDAEIARNMKRKGYAANDIVDLTGLSVAEIEQLD